MNTFKKKHVDTANMFNKQVGLVYIFPPVLIIKTYKLIFKFLKYFMVFYINILV